MTSKIIGRRIIISLLVLTGLSYVHGARGQQVQQNILSHADQAAIVESLLKLEAKDPIAGFKNVRFRKVSTDNIEFMEPSRILAQGFRFIPASEIRESKKSHVVEYVVFRSFYYKEGVVVVNLSLIAEGPACFAAAFYHESNFTYQYQKISGEWFGRLVRGPLPLQFGTTPQPKVDYRSKKSQQPSFGGQATKRFEFD